MIREVDAGIQDQPLEWNVVRGFRVTLNFVTEKWRAFVFEPSHNHELTPSCYVQLIPKYRQLSESYKALVDGLHIHGVRIIF